MNSSKTNGRRSKPSADATSSQAYASRGGFKLRGALDAFAIDVRGWVCLDVGSSTGGFTDCLLQAGASQVWCVDVGYGLLDYKLRKNPKVHLFERTNFRYFDPTLLNPKPQLAVVDVSFISLAKILPKLRDCLEGGGQVLALVKPQFEGTPKEVPGGFVRDEATRLDILSRVRTQIANIGFQLKGESDSVLAGRRGNQETFFFLQEQA